MAAWQRKGILFFLMALLALIAAGLWYRMNSLRPAPGDALVGGGLPSVGNRTPDFQLTDLAGKKVKLADFRGKPVFLNFWATWCVFCRAEFPIIEEAYKEYGAKVVFLAVNTGEQPATAKEYLDRNGARVPVLFDPEGEVARRYLVQGLPTSYFISPDGVIRDKVVGAVDGPGLRTRLEGLLR
ncbi:MAG: TlpA disulfide reductase family protein [Bacillota bacterium]|nr:TlpA disulfide reductase family protein [Bacillota bacterium]